MEKAKNRFDQFLRRAFPRSLRKAVTVCRPVDPVEVITPLRCGWPHDEVFAVDRYFDNHSARHNRPCQRRRVSPMLDQMPMYEAS